MKADLHTLTIDELKSVVERYPWWSYARTQLAQRDKSNSDPATLLATTLHPRLTAGLKSIDIATLTHLSTEDLIDRFLKRDDYRIVAEDGAADDLSLGPQLVNDDEDDEFVSEDLAEIYANQGLYNEAIETYRKLSLLNSEKSIYFAGLIAEIEKKRDKK